MDLLGLIPGVGVVFDITNMIWYIAEGDMFGAICSAISALPVIGEVTGTVLAGTKLAKFGCSIAKIAKMTAHVGNIAKSTYVIGKVVRNNVERYIINGEDFNFTQFTVDVITVAAEGFSIGSSVKGLNSATSQSWCFVAGTLVATADGYKAIEEIETGDTVLSENPETGEVAYKTVKETYVNETTELVHVHVNGEEIIATPTHPFYVNQFGWTRAADLRAGDILVLSNGEYVVVEFIQHEILESPVKVYNFEVEDFHTYFVGEVSVLVHNGCGDDVVGAESSNSSKPMTWNEFQHANKGWSSTELSGRWKKYKSQYVDPLKTNGPSEHGNSLTTSKPAQGYSLRDRTTGEILKYGETTLGPKRYTQAYLDEINADIFWEASGTKAEMHQWQHLKILDYMYVADHRPPLNKSTW